MLHFHDCIRSQKKTNRGGGGVWLSAVSQAFVYVSIETKTRGLNVLIDLDVTFFYLTLVLAIILSDKSERQTSCMSQLYTLICV